MWVIPILLLFVGIIFLYTIFHEAVNTPESSNPIQSFLFKQKVLASVFFFIFSLIIVCLYTAVIKDYQDTFKQYKENSVYEEIPGPIYKLKSPE